MHVCTNPKVRYNCTLQDMFGTDLFWPHDGVLARGGQAGLGVHLAPTRATAEFHPKSRCAGTRSRAADHGTRGGTAFHSSHSPGRS